MNTVKSPEEIIKDFLVKKNVETRKGFEWGWDSLQYTPQGDFVSVKGWVNVPDSTGKLTKESAYWNFQGVSMNGNAAIDLVEYRTREKVLDELVK